MDSIFNNYYCQLNQNNAPIHSDVDRVASTLGPLPLKAIPKHIYYIIYLFIISLCIIKLVLMNSLM